MQLEQRILDKIRDAISTIEENRRAGKTDTDLMRDFEHCGVTVTIRMKDSEIPKS